MHVLVVLFFVNTHVSAVQIDGFKSAEACASAGSKIVKESRTVYGPSSQTSFSCVERK